MMHPIISVRCARDSFKIASGFFAVFTIALASVLCAFTGMCASEKDSGKTYIDLRNRLENGGDKIDYETLMRVYREISETPDPIPHVDRLLMSLISKRNSNPRIDQMILIFAARTIENSRYPIHNVYAIFETILNMDDERLKNGRYFGKDYFRELLERVRSIRASERRIYQQITDIFAECSIDYDPKSETTRQFYAHVQDNFHFAITGHTILRQKLSILMRMPTNR